MNEQKQACTGCGYILDESEEAYGKTVPECTVYPNHSFGNTNGANTVHKDDSVQPVGLKEKWQCLQEKVLDEKLPECTRCKGYGIDEDGKCAACHGDKVYPDRDFSTKNDYGDLEDKLRELGEWDKFVGCAVYAGDAVKYLYGDRTQRAELIYEYFKQKEPNQC